MKKIIGICALVIASTLYVKAQTDENKIKEFVAKYDGYIQQVTEKIPGIPAIAVVVIGWNRV